MSNYAVEVNIDGKTVSFCPEGINSPLYRVFKTNKMSNEEIKKIMKRKSFKVWREMFDLVSLGVYNDDVAFAVLDFFQEMLERKKAFRFRSLGYKSRESLYLLHDLVKYAVIKKSDRIVNNVYNDDDTYYWSNFIRYNHSYLNKLVQFKQHGGVLNE